MYYFIIISLFYYLSIHLSISIYLLLSRSASFSNFTGIPPPLCYLSTDPYRLSIFYGLYYEPHGSLLTSFSVISATSSPKLTTTTHDNHNAQ